MINAGIMINTRHIPAAIAEGIDTAIMAKKSRPCAIFTDQTRSIMQINQLNNGL
jgi:hypothetical protein